jgi:hypothetical protein
VRVGGYDPAQARSRGEVVAREDIESRNGKMTGVGAELQADSETILVYLGPPMYLDLQEVRSSRGDRVEITRVRVLLDGRQASCRRSKEVCRKSRAFLAAGVVAFIGKNEWLTNFFRS